jgi:hypothetical protein
MGPGNPWWSQEQPLGTMLGPELERQVREWFTTRPELHGPAFVLIGTDFEDRSVYHPLLLAALTDRGSLVGVCGYCVVE